MKKCSDSSFWCFILRFYFICLIMQFFFEWSATIAIFLVCVISYKLYRSSYGVRLVCKNLGERLETPIKGSGHDFITLISYLNGFPIDFFHKVFLIAIFWNFFNFCFCFDIVYKIGSKTTWLFKATTETLMPIFSIRLPHFPV